MATEYRKLCKPGEGDTSESIADPPPQSLPPEASDPLTTLYRLVCGPINEEEGAGPIIREFIIRDEGVIIARNVNDIDFIGASVTAIALSDTMVQVIVTGGPGGAPNVLVKGRFQEPFDGVRTSFTMEDWDTPGDLLVPVENRSENTVLVVEGVLQETRVDFTVAGSTVMFAVPPPSDALYAVRVLTAGETAPPAEPGFLELEDGTGNVLLESGDRIQLEAA